MFKVGVFHRLILVIWPNGGFLPDYMWLWDRVWLCNNTHRNATKRKPHHRQHPSTSSKACVSLIDEMINTNNPLIGLPNHAAKRPAMPFCIYMKFICFILGTLSFTRTDININLGKTCYSICTKPLLPRLSLTISSSAAASSIIT